MTDDIRQLREYFEAWDGSLTPVDLEPIVQDSAEGPFVAKTIRRAPRVSIRRGLTLAGAAAVVTGLVFGAFYLLHPFGGERSMVANPATGTAGVSSSIALEPASTEQPPASTNPDATTTESPATTQVAPSSTLPPEVREPMNAVLSGAEAAHALGAAWTELRTTLLAVQGEALADSDWLSSCCSTQVNTVFALLADVDRMFSFCDSNPYTPCPGAAWEDLTRAETLIGDMGELGSEGDIQSAVLEIDLLITSVVAEANRISQSFCSAWGCATPSPSR